MNAYDFREPDPVPIVGRPPKAGDAHDLPPVSVIIPARHAEATLPAALESVTAQDYGGALEVIVADGAETSAIRDLVRRRFPQVRVVPNPEREIPTGLNHALRAARHSIIVRCDARAVLPPGYVARAVGTLLRTGAANVGGRQNPVGDTMFERAVALATTTPLGAGTARYRIGGAEGPVETVYLGVFRRDALDAVGGFDETLLRNEDYELNWRLHTRGEMVWFDPVLVVDYRPRGSLRALARQYFDYGRWKRVVLQRQPRSWRLRQLAAPLLLLALTASVALAAAGGLIAAGGRPPVVVPAAGAALVVAGAAGPLGYLLFLLAGSAAVGLRRRRPEVVFMPVVLATIHLAWATGFFTGAPAGAPRRTR
jgi:succinoglycan biosynthesis protein ExoA